MLTLRDLNRATLARQLLLERHELDVPSAVRRLVALQAQEPRPPYLALAARLSSFEREDLHGALHSGQVVRGTLFRGTLHMALAEDFALFRPVLQTMLEAAMRRFDELDSDAVVQAALRLLAERPHTFNELRPRLQEEFPDAYDRALGYAVRMLTPLVMVPTDDRWGFPRESAFGLPGVPMAAPDLEAFVERYLAAFGPATAADVQAFSGVGAMKKIVYGMRDRLVALQDSAGRELFDLPGAPRPGGDVPAPVRFLPDFDNLVLGHADRTRVLDDAFKGEVTTKNLRVRAVFLVDGFAAGTWQIKRSGKKARLLLTPFVPVKVADLEEEGLRALRFAEPDAADFGLEVVG
ncbi:winged helix DNA-binding domain-containing protein [Nonomuraea sediminis]|uniref:winged helix DNA-binding domain-containing protein n=1 Tax=Nonomuraea sediminis TaxID=2835864 RepID=UPI001BDCC4C1|nr:winged helix DNA-binding domain-containing protein [Nonomuraea sediminis]